MRRRTFPTRHPATIVAVLLLVALPTAAGVTHLAAAQDPGALRSHINRQKGVERQLASAAARLGRLERATSRAVAVMSTRLSETQGELARWQARLAETQRELRVTRERLVRLRARLAESRSALATMLRQRYTADKPDVVSVVLDAKGFADVLERIEFLRRVQHSDTMIVDAVRRGRNDARHDERLLAALEPRQREQTAAVASQRDALARMTAALQSRRAALAQARAARLAALSNTIASRRRAQHELSRLLAAQARAAASQGPADHGRSRGRSSSASPAGRTCRPTPRARRATTRCSTAPGTGSAAAPRTPIRPRRPSRTASPRSCGRAGRARTTGSAPRSSAPEASTCGRASLYAPSLQPAVCAADHVRAWMTWCGSSTATPPRSTGA